MRPSSPSDKSAERGGGCDDRGSASLEFLTAGLLMLVPLVYLILTLGTIQSASLAAEGAARQAARVFVQADSTAAGSAAAKRALAIAFADHGLETTATSIAITCEPRPDRCHTRRGWVTVRVEASVPLPLVPPLFDLRVPLAIPIEASATQQVSRFWGAG
ncbi:hypothetical protein [Microcella humidisoli]|uniref:TadE family protein n=1 Tax=Microcella humidisoli TaxID=2963406 RepID=A0ABY5FWT6_9MICO|nr:hypothetical protein [Microcella humidisoli]UTT62744.1 hypothetical protein NNL39_01085 [Microcella humidisoli]